MDDEICTHNDKNSKAIFDGHVKIIHKILTKMSIMIKATEKEINHQNFNIILVQIMRDLNKNKLEGFQKKTLAVTIITLILTELGMPHIVAHYTSEIIEESIETIYSMGLHRWKRTHKHCIIG